MTSAFRPQIVNFLFTINDVKKVDSENHEITLSLLISMEWRDSRIFCKTEVGFTEDLIFEGFELFANLRCEGFELFANLRCEGRHNLRAL